MRMFRASNRSQMLALWRDNPHSTGTRYVEIALLVDLHPIEGILAFRRSHIEKHVAIRKRSVRVHFVSQDDLPLVLPVIHVEVLLIGRECEPIRSPKLLAHQLMFFPSGDTRKTPL